MPRALQTFGSAGAGEEMECLGRYKHSAPLELGRKWNASGRYKHSAPPEPGRDGVPGPGIATRNIRRGEADASMSEHVRCTG
jgi:hypothetical protein